MAKSEKFWMLHHDRLEQMLNFELLHNNVLQAVWGIVEQRNHYPDGGPFLSPKCTAAHTVGGEKGREKTKGLGDTAIIQGWIRVRD